jgi:hypothetical protein
MGQRTEASGGSEADGVALAKHSALGALIIVEEDAAIPVRAAFVGVELAARPRSLVEASDLGPSQVALTLDLT